MFKEKVDEMILIKNKFKVKGQDICRDTGISAPTLIKIFNYKLVHQEKFEKIYNYLKEIEKVKGE